MSYSRRQEKDSSDMGPEQIKAKILERRYHIQYRLDHAHMKEGCYSPSAESAKAHYEEFSRYNTKEISRFIDEKTGG